MEVVGSSPIKGTRCFLEQETLPLLLSTGWFQERIRAWFHNRAEINWGLMEDWLKCQISSLVKCRQNQKYTRYQFRKYRKDLSIHSQWTYSLYSATLSHTRVCLTDDNWANSTCDSNELTHCWETCCQSFSGPLSCFQLI